MASKKHVTALGVPFDMAALRAKNEKVRAVGNMNVNARGDIIDSHNNVIRDANKRVNVMYEKTMQNRIPPKSPGQRKESPKSQIVPDEFSSSELLDLDDDIPNPDKKS
jgi:hypothetical protein